MEYTHNIFKPGGDIADQQHQQQQASQVIQMGDNATMTGGGGPFDGPVPSPYYNHAPNSNMSYFGLPGAPGQSVPIVVDDCSSGFQSNSVSNCPSTLPSSASTTINEYPPQPMPWQPQPPAQAQQQQQQQQQQYQPLQNAFNTSQMYQLPQQMPPQKLIAELNALGEDRDPVVVLNTVLVLFTQTVSCAETRKYLSRSPDTLNLLYSLLIEGTSASDEPDETNDVNVLAYFAGATIEYISRYEEGRSALLGCNGNKTNEWPSKGIKTLINSLKSHNGQVVVFTIQALHRLLIDGRQELQEIAKQQIIHAGGVRSIVAQLATTPVDSENICQFKVIVMTCLQILAYGNADNKKAILESDGPKLLLRTIHDNLRQPSQAIELIEIASRVLKSLSVCPANKDDIIRNDGIELLTECIKHDNQEILKTCLWTLRNLSDVINNNLRDHGSAVNSLVERLLTILSQYADEPSIVSCALGIMANITCNNEPIKQFICEYNQWSGIDLILNSIEVTLHTRILNNEVLEPAIYTLCHLLNQAHYPGLPIARQRVKERLRVGPILTLRLAPTSEDLAKAFDKLVSLLPADPILGLPTQMH